MVYQGDMNDLKKYDAQHFWRKIAHAQLIIGWYVHETLQELLDDAALKTVVSKGACLLLGWPHKW